MKYSSQRLNNLIKNKQRQTFFLTLLKELIWLDNIKLVINRSQEAALQYKIKSKGTQLNEVNQKIRQVKQKLMRTESELSYTNLDTIKEEVAQLEDKIEAEEAQVNTHLVSNVGHCHSWEREEKNVSQDEPVSSILVQFHHHHCHIAWFSLWRQSISHKTSHESANEVFLNFT